MSRKPKSRVIARVRAGTPPALDELGERRLEKQLTERATQWRKTLANETPRARAALRELLASKPC